MRRAGGRLGSGGRHGSWAAAAAGEGAGARGAAFFSRRSGRGRGGALRPAGAASFADEEGGERPRGRERLRAGAFTSALLRRVRSRARSGCGALVMRAPSRG